MAKRLFHATNWSPTATADATNLASGTFMAVQGGSGTQLINFLELLIDGTATVSAPAILHFARDSTVMVTPTALSAPNGDGPMHPSTAALAAPPLIGVVSSTLPQRSNAVSQGRLELGLNAFGGIMKWNPYTPDMAISILGNTASLGEMSLSGYTGTSASATVSAHIIYEPL